MNDLYIRDNPARVGTPDAEPELMTCQHCGEPITGNYYSVFGEIYCENCMSDFCFGRKTAPDGVQFTIFDLMDEFRVIA